MKIKNYILSLLCVITTFSSTAMAAPVTTEVQPYDLHSYNILTALKIIDSDIRPDADITREMFAEMIARIIGRHSDAPVDATYFYDVKADSEYASDINSLAETNIMNGYTGSIFKPKDNISIMEAVKVLVTLTGYDMYAAYEGGYPEGYLRQLTRLKITLPVKYDSKTVCAAQLADVIYDFLDAPVLEPEVIHGNGKAEFTKEQSVSEKYLGLHHYYGIVTATEQTGIYSDTHLGEGRIEINNTVYTTDHDYCDLLGCYAEYYADEDGMLYYAVGDSKKNRTVKLMSRYITDTFTARKIVYDSEYEPKSTYTLSDVCSFIYNGAFSVFSFDKLIGHDGDITLVDNNNDGIYDIVFCNKYELYVADEISAARGIISDKYFRNKKLDIDKDNYHRLKLYDGDKEIAISDIAKGDVLLCILSETQNGSLKIIRSSKKISGKVDLISDEYADIDGERYYLSDYYVSAAKSGNMPECRPGIYGTFALTPYGEIAYYISEHTPNDSGYGYLYKMYNDTDMERVVITVLNESNEWITADAAENVNINTKKVNKDKLADDTRFQSRQLIRYKLNNQGEFSEINFALTLENNTAYDVNQGYFRSRFNKTESREYKSTDKYFVRGGAVDFFLTDDTAVFVVPESENTSEREDHYIAGASYFKSGNFYDIQPFDETEYNTPAAVLVKEPKNASIGQKSTNTSFIIVDKVKQIWIDGEIYDTLECYMDGVFNDSIIADSDGIFERESGEKLQRGDLIIANMNYFGKINKIQVIKRAEDKPAKEVEGAHAQEFQYIYGRVVRVGNGYITIKNDTNTFRMVCKDPTVTVYDSVKSELRGSDIAEICEGDEVVARNYVSRVKELVVYE